MLFKTRMMLTLGCVSLLALSIPAFSTPAPHGVAAKHRAVQKKNIAQHRPQHGPKARLSARAQREERANRLVSTPISEEPKRPALGWPALVREARKYMGTNPTSRSRLWCATFMNMVLAKVGYSGTNSDAAKSFAQYGRRISEPRVGAIAVLTRGRTGGHVGVVTGIDKQGNPVIISGNHGHRVGEAIYPRSRVIAYVMPTDERPGTTQVADRSAPNRPASEPGLVSPITELLAAIEAEQSRPERPNTQVAQARPQAQPQQQAQAPQPQARPAEPHRAVQQLAEPMPVSTLSARRTLPLDPDLAELLGIRERGIERPPAPVPQRVAPQRQRQVQQNPDARIARAETGIAGVFGVR